jgi:hypothetical protein
MPTLSEKPAQPNVLNLRPRAQWAKLKEKMRSQEEDRAHADSGCGESFYLVP